MSKIINITSKSQFDELIKSNDKIIVDFKADWCGPCKMMHPFFEQASIKHTKVKFAQVDVDANQDLAMEFKVMSIPTTILFEKGKETKKNIGLMPLPKIEEFIK